MKNIWKRLICIGLLCVICSSGLISCKNKQEELLSDDYERYCLYIVTLEAVQQR